MSAARVHTTPANVTLCRLNEIDDGRARNFVLQMRGGRFHGFVVRRNDAVHGYVDRCPHAGALLAQKLDDYLTPDGSLIACSWHGALFTIDEGRCVGGPCIRQKLDDWPVLVENGWLKTGIIPTNLGLEQE